MNTESPSEQHDAFAGVGSFILSISAAKQHSTQSVNLKVPSQQHALIVSEAFCGQLYGTSLTSY